MKWMKKTNGQWESLWWRLWWIFKSFACGVRTLWQVPRLLLHSALDRKYILVHNIRYHCRLCTFSYAKIVGCFCIGDLLWKFAAVHFIHIQKWPQNVNNHFYLLKKWMNSWRQKIYITECEWFYHVKSGYCWPRCQQLQPVGLIAWLHCLSRISSKWI